MASYDDKETDRQLMSLQSQIAKNYQDAYTDIARTASTYWEDLKPRYKNEYAAYINGEHGYKDLEPAAAKAKFDAWYASQIGRGERWEKLRDDMAKRVNEANKAASALINDTTPGIYSLNANYQAYLIEAATGSADFTIYDERTVADLIQGKTQILPTTRVSGPAGEARVRDQLNKALTSGILQGQSIDKIATSFQRVTDMNRNAAIRNARTAMTNAQNAGRQDTYERAEAMGIEMEKEWIATVDDRTRDSHAELDGIRVKVDDPYPNGLMFPGDESSGDGAEYYNCRCTQRAIITKYNGEPRESVIDGHEGVHTEKTYNKWLDEKREAKMDQAPYTAADATARAMEAAEERREAIPVENTEAMAQFVPKYYADIEEKTLNFGNGNNATIPFAKVANSQFNMYASTDLTNRKNPPIILTEQNLERFMREEAKIDKMPDIYIFDFNKVGLSGMGAGYNREIDALYINSALDNNKKITEFLKGGDFASTYYMDLYVHELNGHKAAYDYISTLAEKTGKTYNEAENEAISRVMATLSDDIGPDMADQAEAITKEISGYATFDFDKGKINELIAESSTVKKNWLASDILQAYYSG